MTWAQGGPTHVVWHHDASPPGDSPGALRYMREQLAAGGASAQVWIDRRGTWHFIAAGVVYHAGAVLPYAPGNREAVGIETDHTTGEAWPPLLLASLRRGTRVFLDLIGAGVNRLEFHRTICSPVGRKSDPDGLDLNNERAAVLAAATPEDDDEMLETDRWTLNNVANAVGRLEAYAVQEQARDAGLAKALELALAADADVTLEQVREAVAAAVDPAVLAKALGPVLLEPLVASLGEARRADVEQAVRDVLVSLAETPAGGAA